jgi:hypothetical protein
MTWRMYYNAATDVCDAEYVSVTAEGQ